MLNLLAMTTLARLVSIDDFGLVAMVTAFTAFAAMFRDFGLSAATIQSPTLTHGQVNSLFWVNAVFGALLTVLVCAASPVLAWFYGDERLVALTAVVSTTYAITGLSVQHQAILNRQMEFVKLAIVDLSSMATGTSLALATAGAGAGYWALAVLPVATAAMNAVLLWWVLPWRPNRPHLAVGLSGLLSTGGYLTLFQMVNYLSRNLDAVLIGKFLGATSLGLYTRAYALLMLPIGQISNPVAAALLPALSQTHRDPLRYQAAYTTYIACVTMLTAPLVGFCIVYAPEIVSIVLGQRWIEAAPIFRLLGFAACGQAMTHPLGVLLTSSGRTDRLFLVGVIGSVSLSVAFSIGVMYGVHGVAIAYSSCVWLTLPFVVVLACRATTVSYRSYFASIGPSLAAALTVSTLLLGFRALLLKLDVGAVTVLAIAAPVAVITCLSVNWVAFHEAPAWVTFRRLVVARVASRVRRRE